jgi:hypothetical protein
VLVMHFVHTDRVVSRPLAVIQTVAEGESSLVKCSSNGQGDLALVSPVILCVLCGRGIFLTTEDTGFHRGEI